MLYRYTNWCKITSNKIIIARNNTGHLGFCPSQTEVETETETYHILLSRTLTKSNSYTTVLEVKLDIYPHSLVKTNFTTNLWAENYFILHFKW